APLSTIPVHVRGGSVLLLHSTPSYTTEETKSKPFALLVFLSEATTSATGSAIIDDGISLSKSSLDVAFTASKGSVKGTVSTSSYKSTQPLSNITVLGVSAKPSTVKVGGKAVKGFTYESGLQRLNVTGLAIALHEPWQVTWA
ncbi:hypothetical protein FIBSPDRAFT_963462, partial [Athelia psychrophila]